MCFNPMWRVAVSEDVAHQLACRGISNYHNGAYCIPKTARVYLYHLLSLIKNITGFELTEDDIGTIGCGQCVECRINKSKEWAQRSVAEAQMHEHNYFITLTYDDEHIPPSMLSFSRHTYEFGQWHPLCYEDFQAFKKRLLEYMRYHYCVTDIRFMMCGEYGPNTGRPHFHVIFYNLPLPDVKQFSERSLNGKSYTWLESDIVKNAWSKGFVTIGEVNWDTSAYVSRYVMKKFNSLQEYDYQKLCFDNGWQPLPPEMREASRRPGLARPYYEDKKDEIYKHDKVVLPDGKLVKPCSYFDRLYDVEDPVKLMLLKQQRRDNADIRTSNERARFSNENEYNNYLKHKHEKLTRSINKLKRPL